jgi:hypothetical protein
MNSGIYNKILDIHTERFMLEKGLSYMLKVISFLVGVMMTTSLSASDGIPLNVYGREFGAGDTIYFHLNSKTLNSNPLATLHVWIDNVESGVRRKLRYPILNWEGDGALVVSKDVPPGVYAFNFLAADHFLEISGRVRKVKVKTAFNYETKKNDTLTITELPGPIKYKIAAAMLNREGLLYDEYLNLASDGSFRLPPIVFADTAKLVFNTDNRETYLIDMKTPLDTSFVPFYSQTVFITIKSEQPAEKIDTSSYVFDMSGSYQNSITLQEVIIEGPSKAKQYEDEHVSPLFKDINSKTLSGLDNDEIFRFNDIWTYLQTKVPGLLVNRNGLMRSLMWRGSPVTMFMDELQMSTSDITIPPSEIALIKVYPPPNGITGRAPGGVIALYSKRGSEYELPPSPYTYSVKGYTQGETVLE